VRRLTSPSFASTDCVLSSFKQVTHDDFAAAVRALPNKQRASDPIPTWLLEECSSELVPFLQTIYPNLKIKCVLKEIKIHDETVN